MPSPGAEDRDDSDLPRQPHTARLLHRGLHLDGTHRQSACCFKDHQPGDLVEERAEGPVTGGDIAQVRELVLDERVVEDDDVGEGGRGCAHGDSVTE
jgi:hypothetical protein